MQIHQIRLMPTTVVGDVGSGLHESTLRAYQILIKVEDLLKRGVPTDVVLELIEEMRAPTNQTLRLNNGNREVTAG